MSDPVMDLVALADTVFNLVAGDPGTHADRARLLLERARADGPVEALVVALRAVAEAERLAPRNAAAKALLDEALVLATEHRLQQRVGELLVTRIAVHQELGDLSAAQEDAERAASLLPPEQRAPQLFQHAVLRHNLGHLDEARELYARVLADEACPAIVLAKASNNLAHLQMELGHVDEALALLDDAAGLADQAGPTVVAYMAQTRAAVEMQSGRLAESLARFDEAGTLLEAAGMQRGSYLVEYADALAALRLLPEAIEAAERGLAQLPEHEVSLMAAEGQVRLARLSLLAGDRATARAALQRGTALMGGQGRRGWSSLACVLEAEAAGADVDAALLAGVREAARELEDCGLRSDAVDAHLLAGRIGVAVGRADDARVSLAAASGLSRGAPVLVRLRGCVAAAVLAELDGSVAGVLAACQEGLADLDAHRRALPSMELRARASAHGAELGVLGLRALLRPGSAVDAGAVLAWLERTRAAALAPVEAPPDDHVEREVADLRAAHAELAAVREDGRPEPLELLQKVQEAERAVRRASWAGTRNEAAPEAAAEAHVREALGGAVLVEFGLVDDRVVAVVLGAGDDALVELGPATGLGSGVDHLLFGLRRLARPGAPAVAAAAAARGVRAALEQLRAQLVAPLGLEPGVPLVVVPVGDLQRVPWAPLHDGPVTVVPSAAVWLRTLRPRERTGRVALLGGPDVPGARAELAALAGMHPGALVRAGSTCAEAVEALRGADLAHVACHGRLRTDNPAFSALLLADGPLTVHELSRRAGTPTRVVLAACESGAQVAFPGDEALGFVAALLARGCTGVVASDVLVPDAPSLPLMVALHQALARGATLAQGLHEARRVLDTDDPQQLAVWCAFDAYGGG